MGIYWETIARWIPRRAQLDAKKLGKPLVFLQCVDEAAGMDDTTAWRLLNQYNIYKTGKMHGVLPVHEGMRLRLTEKVDADLGLVQESTGTVVEIAFHPTDQQRYENMPAGAIFRPDHLPAGMWLQVDGYSKCPIWQDFVPHVHAPVADVELDSTSAPVPMLPADEEEFDAIQSFCRCHGACPQSGGSEQNESQLAAALSRIAAANKLAPEHVKQLQDKCQQC
jgi:hypothetical protein